MRNKPKSIESPPDPELGEFRGNYHPRGYLQIVAILMVMFGAGWLTYAILNAHATQDDLLPGVISLVVGIALLVMRRDESFIDVFLYERGMVYHQRGGPVKFRWEDVAKFFEMITLNPTIGRITNSSRQYSLQLADGTVLRFNPGIPRVREIAKAIRSATSERIFNDAIARYGAGEMVKFGPMKVSREGLGYNGQLHPWSTISSVTLRGNRIIVMRERNLIEWPTAFSRKVSNVRIFLKVANAIITGAADDRGF